MATTPNTYGRFIGRVGALAVALGIGVAVANSPGIAVAQDGPSDSAPGNTNSSSTDSTGGGSKPSGAPGTGAGDDSGESGDDGAAPEETDVHGEAEDGDHGEGADEETGEDEDDEQEPTDDDSTLDESDELDESDSEGDRDDESSSGGGIDRSDLKSADSSQTVTTSQDEDGDDDATENRSRVAQTDDSQDPPADATFAANTLTHTETSSFMSFTSTAPVPPTATPTTTGLGGIVSTVLSAFGFGPQATSGPAAPPQPPMLWAMLGWVRREVGHLIAPFAGGSGTPVAALLHEDVSATEVSSLEAEDSPLATEEQLAAERIAAQTANTLPVKLMKIVLRQQFLSAANKLYPGGIDAANMAALDKAVDEYAVAASFQQQLLNSMDPAVVTQVAPPHMWFEQNVPGSRILYDNPDTIYSFMGVNGASEYVITGQFHDWNNPDARPADTTFSVLEGVGGTTSSILTVDEEEFVVDAEGRFVITVSREATGGPNHLQLTSGSTIIAARNTLGDWNEETPMSLSIERVGGPPNSLFAQLGGFAFLGSQISDNPLLTTLVSLVPPLPYMPPVLRGVITAAILVVRGSEQSKYMELATTDPETGVDRPVNTVSQPSSNAEFLANQLQSNGHFQLADDEALVLEIDPGNAGYFIVPTYDVWTITDDYWNQQTSLNNEQAEPYQGTYTIVISKTDPGVTNWVSTGGLNQGTIRDAVPGSRSRQPERASHHFPTSDPGR